ncbi:hypothetical protein P3X46_015970 [Hevea brasiliensis]|uniref:ARC6 IMS domain-containing protein n=1 Tax=Hevea brasiliensis TaxID=3981 RepID=A0ABQ9M007_HEVBR|nr:uncharacterized protein LOC110663564 [Hevea brasiliensis]XP_021678608.2 uncharacterized protein LOC110663564 [Hevea brasiliensis]KAJ9172760.1 hypothetical protein P3X46_015970 [Hevea brasiliensis]
MPTFTAIALDRLLEPGASKSVDKSVPSSNPVPKPNFPPKTRPVPNSKLERRNNTSATERKVSCPQISPALYATPEVTPLPDSPSSFTPSPYIINHKRRGPRLLKSFSEDDVASRRKTLDEMNGSAKGSENNVVDSARDRTVTFAISDFEGRHVNGVQDSPPITGEIVNGAHEASSEGEHMNGVHDGEIGGSNGEFKSRNAMNGLAMEMDVLKDVALNSERDVDTEDFFDPRESISYSSNTDNEGNSVVESSVKLAATTPVGEFYDAWEELSSESGHQTSLRDIEAELREMRLNLLMELEKRKQAEETLYNVQIQWQRIRQQLALVGLTLPAFPITVEDELSPGIDPAEELCQQVCVARFVSDSIGRGIAKAEVEMEKEAQIDAKNFEIARLWDRLHYYEAVNQEMSQRNQEAVEMARRNRQVGKRRQRWVWGSIATVITLGTAALAWSYFPSAKGSSSNDDSMVPEHDDAAK